MPQVDFYILRTQAKRKEQLACYLTDKAWHQELGVYLLADSMSQAQSLDDMLWTFKQDSFLPHDIVHPTSALPDSITSLSRPPIHIGYSDQTIVLPTITIGNVLINLTLTMSPSFMQFQRIAEIVEDTEAARQAGRQRFRWYREQGHEPCPPHEIHR